MSFPHVCYSHLLYRIYIANNDLRKKTITTQGTSHVVTVFYKEKRVVDLYIILFVHIAEFLAESRPRYEEQVDFLAVFHELHVIAIGRFYE